MKTRLAWKFHAVDMHNHVWGNSSGRLDRDGMEALIAEADRYGIERIGISCPLLAPRVGATEFRNANDLVLEAIQCHPDRFFGFCFVDPADSGAVPEIRRCAAHGMAGIKLYHQHLVCDEIQRPVMEEAARLGIPVLMHAGKCTDPATIAAQPNLSHAGHFLRALEMFPDTTLIQAHIGGGGDWEWNLRMLDGLRNPRYFIDLGGSVCDVNIVRRTVEAVGIDSVLFATDMSIAEGVVKILHAGLTVRELGKILHHNWTRLEKMKK